MGLDAATQRDFDLRWARYIPQIRSSLEILYPGRVDEVESRLAEIVTTAMSERPEELKDLDQERLAPAARDDRVRRIRRPFRR